MNSRRMPGQGESDLADRWLVDWPRGDTSNIVDFRNANLSREQVIEKIRNLTVGYFYLTDKFIYLADEADYINMRLAV